MEFTDKPLEPFGRELLDLEIETNLSYKQPLIFRMTRALESNECIDPARRELTELCFDEALTNAMVHGNELDPDKKVHTWVFCDEERWGAIIEDEGEGLDISEIPFELEGEEDELLRETGRGILLMDNYLDELLYNQKGNRLMMIRHREKGRPRTAPEVEQYVAPAMLEFDMEREEEEPLAVAGVAPEALPQAEEVEFAKVSHEPGDVAVIEVFDERLSDSNVDRFRGTVAEALKQSDSLLFDMSHVNYISSVILGAFASFAKEVKPRGGAIKVCTVNPVVMEVLKSMRFDVLLDPQPDVQSGLEKIREETQD